MSNKRFYNFTLVFFTTLSHTVCLQAGEWAVTPTESKASLRGIVAVTDREVWVSGTGGTVTRTVDGGKRWTKMDGLPSDLDFRGLHTFDGKTILAMSAGSGEKSRIYRSVDSGRHWTLVHQNRIPEAFFDSIAFYDGMRGLVIGDPVEGKFFLLATADGGATWARLEGPAARDGEGAFAASNTSLVVKRDGHAWFATGGVLGGRVFRSSDWGRTWTAGETTIPHETASAGVFGLTFQGVLHGYAIGGDYKKPEAAAGVLAETLDGGEKWAVVGGPKGYRSAVVADRGYVVVTGPGGSDYRVGRGWSSIPGEGFHALSVAPGGKVVWASGSNGRVASFRIR